MRHPLIVAALLLALLAPPGAGAVTSPRVLDDLIELGDDRPDEALAAIDELPVPDAASQRWLAVARGLVAARHGREAAVADLVGHLRHTEGDPLAPAGAELVQAVLAQTLGRHDAMARHAHAALEGYRACTAAQPVPDCDADAHWRTLRLLSSLASQQGNRVQARMHLERALEVAQASGATVQQADALGVLAGLHARAGESESALRLLSRARELAEQAGDPRARARAKMAAARVAGARGDSTAELAAWQQAVVLAEGDGAHRLVALVRANLSHVHLRAGRPREALQQVTLALPTVRRVGEAHVERVLLHNAGLAHIALGRVAEGRRTLERLLVMWGADGDRAMALREFGDALAAAGDVRGALELYHRERAVNAEIEGANRESAMRELRQRYDREAQQRNIELLERDGAIKTAQLSNDALRLRLWALAGVFVVLAGAVAVLLYRRVREAQRALVYSNTRLRTQARRDPLTGLANRRHLQDTVHIRGGEFQGALLLIDLDHFKRVNDRHGHAVGDQVLAQVARRLADAVRDDDLVARWGGEEFLVYAPGLGTGQLDRLAERLLDVVARTPLGPLSRPLALTTSIGYAHFPLPPDTLPMTFEAATSLVDQALYTAKRLGRNRAVGIAAAAVGEPGALARLADEFDAASADGRLHLRVSVGPAAATVDDDTLRTTRAA